MYLNNENWLKASIEYENEKIHLESVVTNNSFSDWETCVILSEKKKFCIVLVEDLMIIILKIHMMVLILIKWEYVIWLKVMVKSLLVFMLLVLKIILLIFFSHLEFGKCVWKEH